MGPYRLNKLTRVLDILWLEFYPTAERTQTFSNPNERNDRMCSGGRTHGHLYYIIENRAPPRTGARPWCEPVIGCT